MPAVWVVSPLVVAAIILVLIARVFWNYYFWAKRAQEHTLTPLAQSIRWAGIALGAPLYFIELKSGSHPSWFPYAVLLTCLLVLVLLFVPDASYYLAQAYVKWKERK